jgi:aminopeptidase N
VFAAPLAADAATTFNRTPEMLRFFADTFGPYPFDIYGALVVNERTQFALETQTLPVFDVTHVNGTAKGDNVVAHELVHQWFGDSLTPATWKDIWLSEGFATYGEWLWREHTDGFPVATSAQRTHDSFPPENDVLPGDPGAEHLFDVAAVYQRGALTLQALRLTVGDDAFFTILRTYASRFAGKNVMTNDLINVASEIAQRGLHDVFDVWLYRAALPELPAS